MHINFWAWLVAKDDLLLSLLEFLYSAKSLWGLKTLRERKIGREFIRKNRVTDGRDVIIVLNGPSASRQPIERISKMDSIFVNQGFRNPKYKVVHPKYHVFIDTKMINGVWDVNWVYKIVEMVPDITIVFPAEWAKYPKIKKLVSDGVKILWIGKCISGIRGTGVSGVCFDLAAKLGYKKVYFTGFEATSFPSMLVGLHTHFYGNDMDDNLNADEIETGYYFNLRQYRELNILARKFRRQGRHFINLTDGGILTMFERERFEDAFPDVKKRKSV